MRVAEVMLRGGGARGGAYQSKPMYAWVSRGLTRTRPSRDALGSASHSSRVSLVPRLTCNIHYP